MTTKGITGFVFGLLSFLGSFWGIIPLALGIASVVLCGIDMKDTKTTTKGLSIAGLILGILGIIAGIFWTIIWIITLMSI